MSSSLNKKLYPEEAKIIFVQLLNRELIPTGDQHYQAVTEALTQLKVIESEADFRKRVVTIRADYKRRYNLMAMLNRAKL